MAMFNSYLKLPEVKLPEGITHMYIYRESGKAFDSGHENPGFYLFDIYIYTDSSYTMHIKMLFALYSYIVLRHYI